MSESQEKKMLEKAIEAKKRAKEEIAKEKVKKSAPVVQPVGDTISTLSPSATLSTTSGSQAPAVNDDDLNKQIEGMSDQKNIAAAKKKASVVIRSDTFIRDVTSNWGDVIVNIVTEIEDDPSQFLFSGGLHPVDRRRQIISIDGIKVKHLKWFVATCELRGHHIVSFAKKTDESGVNLMELHVLINFKGKKGVDPAGKHSVVSVKVSFSEIFIAFRAKMGPAVFEKVTMSEAFCPKIYQWNGSMASMFHPKEEDDVDLARILYIKWYEAFQNWYIGVRTQKAISQGQKRKNNKTADEIMRDRVESVKKQRSFYKQTLTTFSMRCRKSWYEGNYVEPEKSNDLPLTDDELEFLLRAASE